MNISNGTHKILFSKGNLYLDGIKIAGDDIFPQKDVIFQFNINKPEETKIIKDTSILEINVFDAIKGKDLGPGQRK